MSAAPKGKAGTRGEKTIIKENAETLSFYFNIITVISIISIGFNLLLSQGNPSTLFYVMHVITGVVFLASYKFMAFMARVNVSMTGELLSCGTDLNMSGGEGMAEYVKDIILLTAIVQALSIVSDYCWLLLLLAPARAVYLFWVYIAGPWFFAEAPEQSEQLGVGNRKQRREQSRQQNKAKRA